MYQREFLHVTVKLFSFCSGLYMDLDLKNHCRFLFDSAYSAFIPSVCVHVLNSVVLPYRWFFLVCFRFTW